MIQKTGWGGSVVKMIPIDEIRKAAVRIEKMVLNTPLMQYDPLNQAENLFLKPEVLQQIGSFKIRGAYNWAASLSESERAKGLLTISAGNTAQAIAYTAKSFGVPAKSIVPASAPPIKIKAIQDLGAEIVPLEGAKLWEYFFESLWLEEEFNFLNPWADPHMMAGNGTIGLEIIEALPKIESVFVPVGGGGLIGGIGSAIKQLKNDVQVVGVQPETYGALKASFENKKATWVKPKSTLCDGVAVPLIVDEMFPLMEQVVDDVILVTEDEVRKTIKNLVLKNRIVVEGAGALATAAALKVPRKERGLSVSILSGNNIQKDKLISILKD